MTGQVSGQVTVLDGGLATELERAGHDLSDALWSARLLRDDPGAVRDAHARFFRAGAQVATTASYQASVEGFVATGTDDVSARRLLRSSVTLARQAAEEVAGEEGAAAGPRLVAASIGPYGAVRADGSEYTGAYGVDDRVLRDFHGPRLELLAGAGADLLALETIPSEQEVTVLLGLLDELSPERGAWLSLTCADASTTRAGEDVARVLGLARDVAAVLAVGVNCTAPEHAERLVACAVAASGKPAVVYPNSGERWDAQRRAWADGDGPSGAGADVTLARRWVDAGARWVGGCCRVGSPEIAALAAELAPRPPAAPDPRPFPHDRSGPTG